MNYIVSAEYNNYHCWQLEILIESFKLNKLEDKLFIALAENNDPKLTDFCFNLKDFKNVFYHENIGQKRNYLAMNRPYSTTSALNNKIISQPFTIIDPDMILVAPLNEPEQNITFYIDPMMSKQYVKQHYDVDPYISEIAKLQKIKAEDHYWIELGSVMTFNNVSIDFFNRVIEWAEIIEYERRKKSNSQWWHSERVAWILTLLEFNGLITYKENLQYETNLLSDNLDCHFIHYNHGMPPQFNKAMYHFHPPDFLSLGNPFEALLQNNPSRCSNYMQQIVRSYLQKKEKN